MRRGGLLLALSLILSSCAIDTELGLEATISSARVTVAADNVVTTRIEVEYRVGEYAEGDRLFQPQVIELYVGDTVVARQVPDVPPGFQSSVSPGQTLTTTLIGDDTMATDPRTLCGPEVRVLFRWLDASMMEIGMTDASTSDVTCE